MKLSIPDSRVGERVWRLTSAVSTPTLAQVQALYKATQTASKRFTSYNFHQYFVRRTEERFQPILSSLQSSSAAPSSAEIQKFYEAESKELEVIKRAAEVNRAFEGPKLVVEHAQPIEGGGGAGMEASAGGGGQPL